MILKNRILFFETLFFDVREYETGKPQYRLFRQKNRGAEKETYLIFSLKMHFQAFDLLGCCFKTTFVFFERYCSQLDPGERL